MAKPELKPRTSGCELKPSEGVDRHGVGLDDGRHVAVDRAGIASLQERASTLAQPRDVGPCDRTAQDQDERNLIGRRGPRRTRRRRRRSILTNRPGPFIRCHLWKQTRPVGETHRDPLVGLRVSERTPLAGLGKLDVRSDSGSQPRGEWDG